MAVLWLAVAIAQVHAQAHGQATTFRAPAGLCERIVRLQNAGRLESALIAGRPAGTWLRDGNPDFTYDQFEYQVDINNDGRIDVVTLSSRKEYGNEAILSARDADGNPLTFHHQSVLGQAPRRGYLDDESARFGFIKANGHVYTIQWASGSYPLREASWLANAAFVDADNAIHVVCTFTASRSRTSHLREGSLPVCAAALKGSVARTPFDIPLPGGQIRLSERERNGPTSQGMAAFVDIDNDGTKEHIVHMVLPAEVSHTCDAQTLARLDAGLTAVAQESLTDFIGYDARTCTDQSLELFVFAGSTYLERRYSREYPSDLHDVLKFERGASATLCRFEVRKHYRVATEYDVFSGDVDSWLWFKDPDKNFIELWDRALDSGALRLMDAMWRREPGFRAELASADTAARYLSDAVLSGRREFVDWLSRHGVSAEQPSKEGGNVLLRAFEADDPLPMALHLIRKGVDPRGATDAILSYAREAPERGAALVAAALRRIGFIPWMYVEGALEENPMLLDIYVASGLPVEDAGFFWENGRPYIEGYADNYDDPRLRGIVERQYPKLLQRRTHKAREVHSLAQYRAGRDIWELRAQGLAQAQDADFGHFATAVCAWFLPADCGPPERLTQARRWFNKLPPCSDATLAQLGEPACRLAERARRFKDTALSWYHFQDGKGARERQLDTWSNLVRDYPLRQWPTAP